VTRQGQHRKKRRAHGLCAREGCQIRTGRDYYCDEHKALHAERMRLARQRLALAEGRRMRRYRRDAEL
jgi:hypothetical protein